MALWRVASDSMWFWAVSSLGYGRFIQMQTAPVILWLRNDLRIQDNAALAAALDSGMPVLPVYIWDEASFGAWVPGGASKWWLHRALESLGDSFRGAGSQLVFRTGGSLQQLQDLIRETGADQVFWNRRYEPPLREMDSKIKRVLHEQGVEVRSFNSALLNEPHTVSTKTGQPYKVYTPYFKAVQPRLVDAPISVNLAGHAAPKSTPESVSLDSLGLLPELDWWRGFEANWEPTEAGAQKRLNEFLEKAANGYDVDRDRPDVDGTSSLSPFLHFGQIGPRQIVHTLKTRSDLAQNGPFVFLKEIYWREFAYNVLYHFPHTADAPLQAQYADFPWQGDEELLRRWQRGQTGYPIVDAGMRQLYETGWMHNRVRMIVSSLLVKHLLQDWKEGAKWFWDTLLDADLASNSLGWQWSGGCGADAAPYFRVFNPIIQGKKFDPDGAYVKRYVPELAKLPARYIHEPWDAPDGILQYAGVELGETYPNPVIEHSAGRARALEAFEQFRSAPVSV